MTTIHRFMLMAMCIGASAACVASGSNVGEGTGGSGGTWSTETGVSSTKSSATGSGIAGDSTVGESTGGDTTSYPSSSAVSSTSGVTASSSESSTSAMSSSSTGTPCPLGTRITYGSTWAAPPNHPNDYDEVFGMTVTWDGVCTPQAPLSYGTLSNGWTPYFNGTTGCAMGFDPECTTVPPSPCVTRITYGASWLPQANHPKQYDDVVGKITWSDNRACVNDGADSYADLSNGWRPYFQGHAACELSFRYLNCGGA